MATLIGGVTDCPHSHPLQPFELSEGSVKGTLKICFVAKQAVELRRVGHVASKNSRAPRICAACGDTAMKGQFPGLHTESKDGSGLLEGVFLVRVDRAFYRCHLEKPFFALRFAILEPKEYSGQTISGWLYCSKKAFWRLNWFLRNFGYDPDLLGPR